jgi:hypothetical protein
MSKRYANILKQKKIKTTKSEIQSGGGEKYKLADKELQTNYGTHPHSIYTPSAAPNRGFSESTVFSTSNIFLPHPQTRTVCP